MDAIDQFSRIRNIHYRFTPFIEILKLDKPLLINEGQSPSGTSGLGTNNNSNTTNSDNSNIEELEEKLLLMPLKSVTFWLINNLIHNTDDLETRYFVRSEFLHLGILKIIKVSIDMI